MLLGIFSFVVILGGRISILAGKNVPSTLEQRSSDLEQSANTLFSEYWEKVLTNDPELATSLGDHRFDDRLTRYDLRFQQEQKTTFEGFLERANHLLPSAPEGSELQFNLLLLKDILEFKLSQIKVRAYLFPVTRMGHPPMSLSMLLEYMQPKVSKDYQNIIARFKAIPTQIDQQIELMREGIRTNFTLHEVSLWKGTGFETANIEDSPFYEPFQTITSLPAEEVATIQRDAKDALQNFVLPAFKKMADFIQNEYSQHARPNIGSSSLPGGMEYYRTQLAFHLTDSAVTPEEIHAMGKQEVERLSREMDEVIKSLGLTMTKREFSDYLRNNKSNFFTIEDEALEAYRRTLFDIITPKLPQLFKNIPKMKLRIQSVPPEQAGGPSAYYMMPTPDGSTPATFYLDTSSPTDLPRYEVMTLSLHEGVPGHHLQVSYSMEQENVPDFRKYDLSSTAYVEGWALYAETLGFELGLYDDKFMRYGHYSESIFRACRMVVDTGMHALGWTQQQAVEYMLQHSASTESNIQREVARYITWPGQAVSYKYGELKIKALRKKAETALGNKFDVREFHDVILRNSGPMELVAKQVDRYIAANS